jgi:hypothetical protein
MTTRAIDVARTRQLEWLLHEALGGAHDARPRRAGAPLLPWLAAAVALLGVGVAFGVAWLHGEERRGEPPAQEPAIPWLECHGPGGLDAVPLDATALRCFDFDDAACGALARFSRLEFLDLSGMDVNEHGYAVSLPITDVGVRALAPLKKLRWLSLAQCPQVRGEGLQALESLPLLEHLDLTYSGVESPAIERLPRLPGLRTLVLSHCMAFHGRSLSAVATIPGLRRLELRACTTLSAADVLPLARAQALRWLDLRDCQGRFRGQRARGPEDPGDEQPPPAEDGVGITDEVVAALAALPLETLLLGGSESLTDAIAEPLARMPTLRHLDLSELPRTTAALLARLPAGLTHLELSSNPQFDGTALQRLPALPALQHLGLSGMGPIDAPALARLLDGRKLRSLRLGGSLPRSKDAAGDDAPKFTPEHADVLAAVTSLVELDLGDAWPNAAAVARLAALPKLRVLDLSAPWRRTPSERTAVVKALAGCRSLQVLRVARSGLAPAALDALRALPLQQLDLRGCSLAPEQIRAVAGHWPGCVITMPDGARFRAP